MINALINIIGEYVPLAGDGIASLNPVWLLAAVLLCFSVWFVFRMVLKIFDWLLK